MKKINVFVFIAILILTACGTAPVTEEENKEEAEAETVESETVQEKEVTLADGIIPYMASTPMYFEYDLFDENDQQEDHTVSRIISIVPLRQEGEFYESIMKVFSPEELDGELYYVKEVVINNGNGARTMTSDQIEDGEGSLWIRSFWVMKDDPQSKTLLIKEYNGKIVSDPNAENKYDFYFLNKYKDDNRYVIDYSGMENDDWKMIATEKYEYAQNWNTDVFDYDGYVTPYKPEENIKPYSAVHVKVNNLRIRNSPEVKDDNKTGSIDVKTNQYSSYPLYYFLFEKRESGEYTWYRIGKNKWIASDGTWVEEID